MSTWAGNAQLVRGINRLLPMPFPYSDRREAKVGRATELSPRNPGLERPPRAYRPLDVGRKLRHRRDRTGGLDFLPPGTVFRQSGGFRLRRHA
ncbi:MAG: hypothetical protein V8T86_11360 [Victivallis sp.]